MFFFSVDGKKPARAKKKEVNETKKVMIIS
jgi:hypothetical protein